MEKLSRFFLQEMDQSSSQNRQQTPKERTSTHRPTRKTGKIARNPYGNPSIWGIWGKTFWILAIFLVRDVILHCTCCKLQVLSHLFGSLSCMSHFDRPFWIYQNWNEFKFVYHSPFFFFDFFVSSGKLWKNISRTSTLDLSFEYMFSACNIGSKLKNLFHGSFTHPQILRFPWTQTSSTYSLSINHLFFFWWEGGGRCRHTFNIQTANVFSALVSCLRFPGRFETRDKLSRKTPKKSKTANNKFVEGWGKSSSCWKSQPFF